MSEVFASREKRRKYFTREKLFLKLSGISLTGNESTAYKVYSFICLVFFSLSYPLVAASILFTHGFDDDAMDNLFYSMASGMSVFMGLTMYRNRSRMAQLIKQMEEPPFAVNMERGGPKEEQLICDWLSFTNKQGLAYAVGVLITLLTQMGYTLTTRIMYSDSNKWKLGFSEISIVNVSYSPNYEIVWLYQNLALFAVAFNVCPTTLVVSGTLAFASIQYKILQNNIKRMVKNSHNKMLQDVTCEHSAQAETEEDASKIPWKYLRASLEETVVYHLKIIDFAAEIEEIFSGMIFLMFLGTLAVTCVEVFRAAELPLTDPRVARTLIEMLTTSLHALLSCYCSEQMAYESQKVAKVALETNFVGADLRFQKALIIIMRRTQDSKRIKAGKLIEASVFTYAWIMRTSYSVYMVLRSTGL